MKKINKMMKPSALLLVWVAFLSAACSDDDNKNTPDPDALASVKIVDNSIFGQYLVDTAGRTLYILGKDVAGSSVCAGGCATAWPAFHTDGSDIGMGLDTSDFGAITRADGAMQTTYKGWPLYYFSGDEKPGQINGNGSGLFYVAKPDYDLMIAEQEVHGENSKYLVDDRGNTLYSAVFDTPTSSGCQGGCLNVWPIFESETGDLIVPSGINVANFGAFSREGGALQLTYDGMQLYFFANDNERGDINGINNANFLLVHL